MATLKTHPACDLVPKMSAEAYDELRRDIEKHGQIEPITVIGNVIIDGRHRYRACRELGITCKMRQFEGTDVESFVISTNLARRHLSTSQKTWLIKRLLALHPERSNRAVAATVGVSHHTVQRARADESGGQIAHLDKHIGRDGKEYPAPRRKPITHSAASLITQADLEARRFVKWLDDLHPNELTDRDAFIAHLQEQLARLLSVTQTVAR